MMDPASLLLMLAQGETGDPHKLHAMLVHYPIALGLLGPIPVIVLALTRFQHRWLRLACIAWFLVAAGFAGAAAGSGEAAEERLWTWDPALTAEESAAVDRHAQLGEGGWMWPTSVAVLLALGFVSKPWVRWSSGVLSIVASLVVAGWVVLAAGSGGDLVYDYGLGVPDRTGVESAPATPITPPDDAPAATDPRETGEPAGTEETAGAEEFDTEPEAASGPETPAPPIEEAAGPGDARATGGPEPVATESTPSP